jgi:hypothetical protein
MKQLSKEELQQLISLKNEYILLTTEVGQLELQIMTLQKQKQSFQKRWEDIEIKEKEMASILTQKYGEGNIDLETGNII